MSYFGITQQEIIVVLLSLRIALAATLAMLPLAVGVAMILARGRFWGHGVLNAVVHLPLILPPVVTGYLLLVVFGRTGPLGHILLKIGVFLPFSTTGAAVAAGIMAFPLMVRAIRLAIEAVDPKLEEAAATLGASRMGVFRVVTVPLILPGIIAGSVLGFAKALGEFGATITFVSNIPGQTQTIASAIYELLQVPGQEASVTRLILLSCLLSFVALIVSEQLARRMNKRRVNNL